MKNILFVFSIPRIAERLFPLIPELYNLKYKMDLMTINQFSSAIKWYGDKDPRERFYNNYKNYFLKHYDTHVPEKHIDYTKYDLIILDDCRERYGLDFIYKNKRKDSIVIAQTHGNTDKNYISENRKKVFDYCFVFGMMEKVKYRPSDNEYLLDIGIPSNDILKEYKEKYTTAKHILVIVNFLGNRECPFKVKFDESFIEKSGLKRLSEIYNLPIVIKLKSRADENGYKHNIEYLKKIINDQFKYEVVIDSEDDNKLIAESKVVISAPSTLAFKSIQIGIPTVIIKKSGQLGLFKDFECLSDLSIEEIYFTECSYKDDEYMYHDFIEQNLTGGLEFNSTQIAINKIKELCPIS